MRKQTKFTSLLLISLMTLGACSSVAVSRKQAIQILNEIDFFVENYAKEHNNESYYVVCNNAAIKYKSKVKNQDTGKIENVNLEIEISPVDKNGYVYVDYTKHVGGQLAEAVESWCYISNYRYYEKNLVDGVLTCTKVIDSPELALKEFIFKHTTYRAEIQKLLGRGNKPATLAVYLDEISKNDGSSQYKEQYMSSGIRSLSVKLEKFDISTEGKELDLSFQVDYFKSYLTYYTVDFPHLGMTKTFEIDYYSNLTKPGTCVQQIDPPGSSEDSLEE